jgi:hypothetical protein
VIGRRVGDTIMKGGEVSDQANFELASGVNDNSGRHLVMDSEALEERNLRVKEAFAAVYGPLRPQSLLSLISDVIDSQHADGSWGSDDSPRLKPALTAQTIILLWRLGIRYSVHAGGSVTGLGPARMIARAVHWLVGVQREDGGWGEDAWDTCHVLEALGYCGYQPAQPNVAKGLGLLRSHVDEDWPDRSSYWYGAGFQGAAMIVFNTYRDAVYAKRTLDQVWRYWDSTQNHFNGPEDSGTTQRAPAAWHTACTLLGLKSFGSVAPHPGQVDKAYAWLRGQQTEAGCWSPGHLEITCYTTKQVIAALASSGYETNHLAAKLGTDWFIKQCNPDVPLAVRLMAGFAVARTRADELVTEVSFYFVSETSDLLDQYRTIVNALVERGRQLEREIKETTERSRVIEVELQRELGRYAVKLTERQVAVWSLLLAMIGIAIGLVVPLF